MIPLLALFIYYCRKNREEIIKAIAAVAVEHLY